VTALQKLIRNKKPSLVFSGASISEQESHDKNWPGVQFCIVLENLPSIEKNIQ